VGPTAQGPFGGKSHGWEERRFRPSLRDLEDFIDRKPTFEKVGYYRVSRRDFADTAEKVWKRSWLVKDTSRRWQWFLRCCARGRARSGADEGMRC